MTKRRAPLRFDELEPKGRASILRSRDEVLAEQAVAGNPASRTSGNPDVQSSGREEIDRSTYMKATYRICPEAVEAIDEIKRRLRMQMGRRVTYEEIAEAALMVALDDLEKNRESSYLARWISGDTEIRKSAEPERPPD